VPPKHSVKVKTFSKTNWQELESFFKAFQSRCVVSRIAGNKVMLSPDRKLILQEGI
jgi:hypothetical protein